MCRWVTILAVLSINMMMLIGVNVLAFRLLVTGSLTEPIWNPSSGLNDFFAFEEMGWWGFFGLPALVVCATQAMFVLPVVRPRAIASDHGKSLKLTVAAAAVVAAALTVALIFAVLESANAFEPVLEWLFDDQIQQRVSPVYQDVFVALGPWLFIGGGWLLWTPLLWSFARKRIETRWGRWIGWLLAGTVLETLIVVPIDIMVRRRTDCYCGTGTFFALVISTWALLWLTGPGIVLALTSKRRRLWFQAHCSKCGYARGPSPGDRCPECGVSWRCATRESGGS